MVGCKHEKKICYVYFFIDMLVFWFKYKWIHFKLAQIWTVPRTALLVVYPSLYSCSVRGRLRSIISTVLPSNIIKIYRGYRNGKKALMIWRHDFKGSLIKREEHMPDLQRYHWNIYLINKGGNTQVFKA